MTKEFEASKFFKRLLVLAINEAKKVNIVSRRKNKYRLGCVIWKKREIISLGRNDYFRTHPLCKIELKEEKEKFHHFLHAEIDACIGIDRDELRDSSVLTVRIDSGGKLKMARPCTSCWLFLTNLNVRRIFWTNNQELIESYSSW